MEKAPAYPADEAFLIYVSLTPTATDQWRANYNGRQVGVTKAIPFATTVLDLRCSMEMWVRGPFDYLHYYLSAPLLKRIAANHGTGPARFAASEDRHARGLEPGPRNRCWDACLAPARAGEASRCRQGGAGW